MILKGVKYQKARNRCKLLPKCNGTTDALELLRSLHLAGILSTFQPQIRKGLDKPWYRRFFRKKEKEYKEWKPIEETDLFIWVHPVQSVSIWWFLPILHVFVLLALYSLRINLVQLPSKIFLFHTGIYTELHFYLSFTTMVNVIICLFLAPFIIVFVRSILFITTHLYCPPAIWLFPNLFSDSTFLGPFRPLYAWDTNPKETLDLRWRKFKNSMLAEVGMLKRRRGDRTRRISRGMIKSLQMKTE